MSLSNIIDKANETYALNLTRESAAQIRGKLALAGLTDHSPVPQVLDVVLAMAKEPVTQRYARMKEVKADVSSLCPRCKSRMATATLLGARRARYCTTCKIALPIKKEA